MSISVFVPNVDSRLEFRCQNNRQTPKSPRGVEAEAQTQLFLTSHASGFCEGHEVDFIFFLSCLREGGGLEGDFEAERGEANSIYPHAIRSEYIL